MSKKWNVTYYIEADGTKPVEEYIRKLSVNERAKRNRDDFLKRFTEQDIRGLL
jgi:hypothetical protein